MALKEEILAILESNRNRAVSGQELAEKLSVTRAAVWKAVKSLKTEGHIIEAVTNRGYRLQTVSDVLSAAGIKTCLKHDCRVEVYDKLESTNITAKLAALNGAPANTVIAANCQTGGRGRRGRAFYSPPKSGVYFSVILRPNVNAKESVLLTTAAAVSAAEAIEELTGKKALIKWINDVYVEGKKCVGILSEAVFDCESGAVDSVIVGIGINVSTHDFPPEIADKAGSIGAVSRNALVAAVTDKLIDICESLPDNSHLVRYRKRCFLLGDEITVIPFGGEKYNATALSVDDEGRLVVKTDSGEEKALSNEEVSVRSNQYDKE